MIKKNQTERQKGLKGQKNTQAQVQDTTLYVKDWPPSK